MKKASFESAEVGQPCVETTNRIQKTKLRGVTHSESYDDDELV